MQFQSISTMALRAECALLSKGRGMTMTSIVSRNWFQTSALNRTEVKGQIASKMPTKIQCEEGKMYSWCACGLSSKQPLCDGSHKRSPVGLTPLRWKAPASKEYWFCNCKQTNNKPYCDSTHKKL